MAAIEKVCEFSGEYPSWLMYGYKLNQLQIMPKYRKLFRGAEHTLYISRPIQKLEHKGKWGCSYRDNDYEYMKDAYEPSFTSEREYLDYLRKHEGYRLVNQYDYCLHVPDAILQGEVKGVYVNSTYHLPTMLRKLKRLLRCKKVNVVWLDGELYEGLTKLRLK